MAQVEAKMHPKPIENFTKILMNFEVVIGRARDSENTGGVMVNCRSGALLIH